MTRHARKALLLGAALLTGAFLFHVNAYAGTCSAGCRTWFDGCNTCDCSNGRVVTCTREICDRQETPRCVDPPSPTVPAASVQNRSNEDGCLAYARAAVEQYETLHAAGCDCSNARWHDKFEVHRTWCLSLPSWNDARPEFDVRQTDIGWCKAGRRPC